MSLQTVASNIRRQMDSTSQRYIRIMQTCRDTQRDAVGIVLQNGRSVANTEIGAAKNMYTSARAVFVRAREDGLSEMARHPVGYLPAGRKQMSAAYRATLDLLNKTRGELTDVATDGYRRIRTQWSGAAESDELVQESAGVESVTAEDPASTQDHDHAATAESTAKAAAKTAQGDQRKQPARRSTTIRKRKAVASKSSAAKTRKTSPATKAKAVTTKKSSAAPKATAVEPNAEDTKDASEAKKDLVA